MLILVLLVAHAQWRIILTMVSKEACLILGNCYWRNNNKAVVSFYHQLIAKQMPYNTHLHFLEYCQLKMLMKDISFRVTKAKRTGALEST